MQARRYPIPPLAATMSDDEVRIGTSIGTSSNPLGEITNFQISSHGIARHSMPTGVHQNVSVTGHKTFDDTPHSNGKVETLMALPAHAFLVPLLCEPRSAVFQAKHEGSWVFLESLPGRLDSVLLERRYRNLRPSGSSKVLDGTDLSWRSSPNSFLRILSGQCHRPS